MFSKEIYTNRRNNLKKSIESGILLFLGNSEASMNYAANTYGFRQDSTFLYFFGFKDPDFAAIIDVESGEEIIFGNDVDIDDIIWMGPQPAVKDKAAQVGVAKSMPFASLFDYISKAIDKNRKIHYLPSYRYHNKILLNKLLGIPFDNMKDMASEEFIKAVVALREIKEDVEIVEIEKACNIGYAMHSAVMKMAKLGMVEQELVGIMEGISRSNGSMPSFPIILSQNGETLHNHSHHQILTDGRMIVVDAGAEANSGYSSDFTRSIPSSGKFSSRQRDIYTIVATANNLALDISRPGITYREVHLAAAKVLAQGLINLGLMRGDVDEAVAAGAHALFMPHGLGHQM